MLPDFGGIVVVENYLFLDLVSVACLTGFLSVVWHSWRIFSKHNFVDDCDDPSISPIDGRGLNSKI